MSAPIVTPLREVIAEAQPGFACGDEVSDGIFQIRMNNITRDGLLDTNKKRLVPRSHKGVRKALLQDRDILFNATNSPDLVGKTALIRNPLEPTVYSNHFLRLRVNGDIVDPSYLHRWLNSEFQRGVYKAMCRQWVNQATLSRDALLSTTIPILPLKEQQRIAEVLDRADALRAKRRQAISLLDDLAQSLLVAMFGDPTSNPHGLPTEKLSDLAIDFRYGTSTKSADSGYPALRIPNVIGGSLDLTEIKTVPVTTAELDRLRLREGDLLFVRTNGNPDNVGRCATFNHSEVSDAPFEKNDWIYASYLIRARVNQDVADPTYVREFMLSPAGRTALREHSKTSAGQFNINIDGLGSVRIPIPPVEAQRRYAAKLTGLTKHRDIALTHLAHLDTLFASLQSRAFRGELWQDDLDHREGERLP